MSYLRKTKYGTFEVQWRADGKYRSRTFKTRAEAKRFAGSVDASPEEFAVKMTVAELADIYGEKCTVLKKGYQSEFIRLDIFKKSCLGAKNVAAVTSVDIENFIEERKECRGCRPGSKLAAGTILKDLATLSVMFTYAVRQGWIKKNPCRNITNRPKAGPPRERVITDEEKEKLLYVSGWDGESPPENKQQLTMSAFFFACLTGMRTGEILGIEESWIDGNVIHLPKEKSKTGCKRDIALSEKALAILEAVKKAGHRPQIWGLSAKEKDVTWRNLRAVADLGSVVDSNGNVIKEGVNFHDSRATFCTWAAGINPETGAPRLDVLALAKQIGHKDLRMLQRYYRPDARTIAEILNNQDKPKKGDS